MLQATFFPPYFKNTRGQGQSLTLIDAFTAESASRYILLGVTSEEIQAPQLSSLLTCA